MKIGKGANMKTYRNSICPKCNEECKVVPRSSSFDYIGTHCTHGLPGTHYPNDHGAPESDCCGEIVEDAEVDE